MAARMHPQKVADAFVEQYYVILKKCPENVHKFYQESSLLAWPGPDGVVKPVTTLSGINAKIMSSDYKSCHVEIKTVDALESVEGGFIVAVTGLFIRKDTIKKSFSQFFFLAKQERGFFVLNDILRFCNTCGSITNSAANDDEKSNQAAPFVQNSVSPNLTNVPASNTKAVVEKGYVSDAPASNTKAVAQNGNVSDAPASNTKAVVQNGNVKETLDIPVPKATDAKVASYASSLASGNTKRSVLAPTPNVEEKAQKNSYASMVAKKSSATAPKTVRVPSNADSHAVAPSTNKTSVPHGDFVSKASAPSSNVAPKLPVASNGAPNGISHVEATTVYIGGLPYDITKQGVVDVVKRFGPVRRSSDSVQLRRHEDGFCCGFVEFESADAARRAVEVHHVRFGEKEAYITHKRSSFNGGNDGRGRSPTRGGQQNGNFRGREVSGYGKGQPEGLRRS